MDRTLADSEDSFVIAVTRGMELSVLDGPGWVDSRTWATAGSVRWVSVLSQPVDDRRYGRHNRDGDVGRFRRGERSSGEGFCRRFFGDVP